MDELAKRFAELAQQYGPTVIDAAKHAAQISAFASLASSLIGMIFAVGLFTVGRYLWTMETDDEELTKPLAILLFALASVPLATAAWMWIDPWTWVGLFHPEIYIAHTILKI